MAKLKANNLVPVWYALYERSEPVFDKAGRRTSERRRIYSKPRQIMMSVSAAKGDAFAESFGQNLDYDRILLTDDVNCPIDEYSVLTVGERPEMNEAGDMLYTYVVALKAKSRLFVRYAVKKVERT